MEPTWEGGRWALAGTAGGVWAFFSFVNLTMTAVRYVQHRRASSVPLMGTAFGLVALLAAPVDWSWWGASSALAVLAVVELLGRLWPAGLD